MQFAILHNAHIKVKSERQKMIQTHVFAAAGQTDVSKTEQLGQFTVLRKLLIPHHLNTQPSHMDESFEFILS